MPTLATRQVRRQRPLTLTAGEKALMRWYPDAPLLRIDALRNQRPRYPLIQGGKPDECVAPPFTCGHGRGGHAA